MKALSRDRINELVDELSEATAHPFHDFIEGLIKSGTAGKNPEAEAQKVKALVHDSLAKRVDELSCDEAKYLLLEFLTSLGVKESCRAAMQRFAQARGEEGGFAE